MKNNQMSDSKIVALLLTMVGGFLELYSYTFMNNVFATAITGNIVLLAYFLKNREFYKAGKYAVPILFFMIGIYISEIIRRKYKNLKIFHWRNIILIIELSILTLISLLNNIEYIGIPLISFTSGLQIQAFRKFSEYSYFSTMVTGNTRQLVEAFVHKDMKKVKGFLFIIISFVTGVILSDVFIEFLDKSAIYFPIAIILIVFILINKKKG